MNFKILVCKKCGNIVEVIKASGVPIVCCGVPMVELVPNTVEASLEKHIPMYEINGNNVFIKVAEVEHPMEKEHYIEWILIKTNNGFQIKYLNYTDKPECNFTLSDGDRLEAVYAYCNLHGLWVNDVK